MDFDTYWFAYLVAAIIDGVIWGMVCKYIISTKGYDEEKQNSFFWVGFFLALIGVIVAVVTPQNTSDTTVSMLKSSNKDDEIWDAHIVVG